MKINKITWRNWRGLADGEIVCNGHDVTISGRNGVGKTSIGLILPFVLNGRVSAKSFDDRGLVIEMQTPEAEIEFDSITLKRSVTSQNKNRTFINGKEVSATKFNAAILNLTKDQGLLLFNPFEFPILHWKDQRDFLIEHFVPGEPIPEDSSSLVDQRRQLKREVDAFPGRIEEVKRQLVGMLLEDDVEDLEELLRAKNADLERLRPQDFSREERFLKERLAEASRLREELLAKYRAVKDYCPTCGQPMPRAKVEETRRAIVAQGKRVAAQIEKYRDDLESLQSKRETSIGDGLQIKTLQDEIRSLTERINTLRNEEKLQKRLEELIAEQKQANARLIEVERRIENEQRTRQSRIVAAEKLINEQFEHVKFKLFKLQANGELKPDCAAMIDGVPYANLSKGEKFKAAMDILRTFQKVYGLEMPLFIDDAESYTSNSFVTIPNQLFLFKVTDDDLKITVEKARLAA